MGERKLWFITRPERDPKYHRDALSALNMTTNGFTLVWKAQRELHKEYEKQLALDGVKRESISNDGSGGRTWAAMLKTFSYIYAGGDGCLKLTKVGKALLKGEKIRENVTKQIMTLQIPNAYFLEAGFRPKFEEGFRIRPARFLVRLTNQEKLDYHLTKEEIVFFALMAKRDDQLEEVTETIRYFRMSSEARRQEIKEERAAAFEHRERTDSKARSFEENYGDVAHTFMMLCEYTELVEYIRGSGMQGNPRLQVNSNMAEGVTAKLDEFDKRYPLNTRYMLSLERMALSNGLDVDSYKASSYEGSRPAANRTKELKKAQRLLAEIPMASHLDKGQIIDILRREFSAREAEKLAEELLRDQLQDQMSNINEGFVQNYLAEEDNLLFEDKTAMVLREIGFDVRMRVKPKNGASTEVEILLLYGDRFCGIIDAKNYKKKFSLSASLTSHMASEYIPNYEGIFGREIGCFGYVTARDFGGEANLEKISSLAKREIPDRDIPGFMIKAVTLLSFLDYCVENQIPKEDRVKLFLSGIKNKGIHSLADFSERELA